MENFLQEMGFECPETGWKAQAKMFAQLVVIGAIAFTPMVLLMALAGWVDRLCE